MVYKFHIPTAISRQTRLKELKGSLISVAGISGRKIVNQEGQELGIVVDLVCHWNEKETYPPLTGIIAKVARRKVWISSSIIERITPTQILLGNAKLDMREFKARSGEVCLKEEILDHQLIDVNGARVVRASDLYVALLGGKTRLVGVDVGYRPLIRRIGPSQMRKKAVPDSVIDWATIQSFGGEEGNKQLRLSANRRELRRMRPGELADLLEDLGRPERQELLNVLTPEQAADALEEMEPKELEGLLRESSPKEGANFLSNMEPDEAADALRDVDEKLREELISLMPKETALRVSRVLGYDEETAGGIMTTQLLIALASDTVGEIKERLNSFDEEPRSLSAIAIIDENGKLLYDLHLSNLLNVNDSQDLRTLMKPPATVTVNPDASLKEVAELLVESRSSSIIVTDSEEQPLGRIFADDLLDGLLPGGRFHFPRLLSS